MLLSTEGIDTNRAREDGMTPLYIACEKGHLDVVRMLLSTEGIENDRAKKNGEDSSVHCLPEGPSGCGAHAVKY